MPKRAEDLEFDHRISLYVDDIEPFDDQWKSAHELGLVTATEQEISVYTLLDRALERLRQKPPK